jgi:uncharacterized protein (DUF362 family)
MGNLEGLSLEFDETMAGWLGVGEVDPVNGRMQGERDHTPFRVDGKITIPDVDRFLNISDHTAIFTGTATFEPLGGASTIRDGVFNLFSVDPEEGIRHMTYTFRFTGDNGKTYFCHGLKKIKDDPGPLDVIQDMTTLFTTLHEGENEQAPIYASGQIFFNLTDTAALAASMRVTGATWWGQETAAKIAFISFAFGVLRGEYLRSFNPLYDTKYENLVLSGQATGDRSQATEFFLVSGVHDKDFPWGDGEIFWDVLLVLREGDSGYRRYCITDRVLRGLKLNVDRGTYTYRGPIFELTDGFSASFSQMRHQAQGLRRCEAEFEIRFEAHPYATTPLPFVVADKVIAELSYQVKLALSKLLPSESLLGIYITPHTVKVTSGSLRIIKDGTASKYSLTPEQVFGEAESSTFRSVKEPTLLYNYICAISPGHSGARVQIQSGSMRNERQHWVKDQIDRVLGAIVSQVASKEMLMEGGKLSVRELNATPRFTKVGHPILEANNDHFPTAVFQRRIIEVQDPAWGHCLALEENMNALRLDAVNSGRNVAVAAIRDENKFKALDLVLEQTGFWDLLKGRLSRSGKSAAEFSIVIKPNFMFAYNKADHSTYTDPELVHHFVDLLRTAPQTVSGGFSNITVVEAQSTYGEFFDNRRVREVAQYLGYDVDVQRGYQLVDLTEDTHEWRILGTHLGNHPVPVTWRDADFRISFAKNKTHAYAYYTLTVKNIYGALPLANKFKEYHCDRDIYYTTLEYLKTFPVDYGLVDAYMSADGPFGIFTDSEPNPTKTIIGGEDLVAVDWVGATKMGLDPMISDYMKLAVEAFGKPEITFVGDPNPYWPWLNVPTILSLFTHYGLDANHYFGNLLYMTGAYMDESQFKHKSRSVFIKGAREAIKPLIKAFFIQAGGDRTLANRWMSRLLTKLGE